MRAHLWEIRFSVGVSPSRGWLPFRKKQLIEKVNATVKANILRQVLYKLLHSIEPAVYQSKWTRLYWSNKWRQNLVIYNYKGLALAFITCAPWVGGASASHCPHSRHRLIEPPPYSISLCAVAVGDMGIDGEASPSRKGTLPLLILLWLNQVQEKNRSTLGPEGGEPKVLVNCTKLNWKEQSLFSITI